MTTEQKPETTPATAKSNGKRKIKKHDVTEIVDHYVPEPTLSNGIDASNQKKKKKMMKGDNNEKGDSLLYQIPMSRVSRIIKSEDPNVRITHEAVYIINKASENFLQVFTTEAYANVFLDREKYIDYNHLLSVVSKRRRFDFLSDFVPEKVKAEDALVELQAVEN